MEDTSAHFNIFVGDLSPEVTDATLYACFSVYPSCSDARVMWDHKTGRSRGFGFVAFRNQQCSWGNKPTPAGTASNPLPPPVPSYQILAGPGMNQGYSAAELLAYQRQLALNQMQGLANGQASASLSSGGSQNMYNAYPNSSSN